MSGNVNAPLMGGGNGNYRMSNGAVVQNAMYDSYYNNLVELDKLNQVSPDLGHSPALQSYYDSNLQSPGSTGIPDIILTGEHRQSSPIECLYYSPTFYTDQDCATLLLYNNNINDIDHYDERFAMH